MRALEKRFNRIDLFCHNCYQYGEEIDLRLVECRIDAVDDDGRDIPQWELYSCPKCGKEDYREDKQFTVGEVGCF